MRKCLFLFLNLILLSNLHAGVCDIKIKTGFTGSCYDGGCSGSFPRTEKDSREFESVQECIEWAELKTIYEVDNSRNFKKIKWQFESKVEKFLFEGIIRKK